MIESRARKRLASDATRIIGRLPEEKRAELAAVAAQVEEELRGRIKKASPARVALAKLKVARLREGLSLGEIAEKSGIDRGNLSKLENSVDNVELNTLARLADALGYDVVVRPRQTKLAGSWRGGSPPTFAHFRYPPPNSTAGPPAKSRALPVARSAGTIGHRRSRLCGDQRPPLFPPAAAHTGGIRLSSDPSSTGRHGERPELTQPKSAKIFGSTASGTKDTEPSASPMFAPPG